MEPDDVAIRFGPFELDPESFTLRREGEAVPVEPQVFDVLHYLAANRGRLVAKTELLDNVWGDRFVSESALTSRIKSARQAVDDDGRRQAVIRTIHGRGYQFVADVDADEPDAPGRREEFTDSGGLIGRDADLEAVWSLTRQHRIVSVLGTGGVGKTRLATEVARQWEHAGNRAVLVPLEPLRDPDLLPAEIFEALGFRADSEIDLVSALAEAFRDETAPLVVLDNFEHLTDAAPHVARLIDRIPQLRVLVTSRERLRLSDEHTFDLSPLSLERVDGMSAAAELFEQAAQRASADFRITDENTDAVATICRLVDGLPLAIELAAAQVHYLPLDYLVTHLESNVVAIGEEFADRPTRQRSVNDLIEWSYQLLDPAHRSLLARLSVFRGGWSIAGARAVGGFSTDIEALAGLRALIDKSLVRSRPVGDVPRFSMLNLVRRFAEAKLDERDDHADTLAAHTDFVVGVVREIEQGRWGPRTARWREDVSDEYGNISTVLERADAAGDAATLGRIVGDLNVWWYRMGRHAEGRRWINAALAGIDHVGDAQRGRVLLAAGFMALADQRIDFARTHYRGAIEAADAAGDWRYAQFARANLSATELTDPERFDDALARVDGVITAAEERGELPVLAHALNVAGVLLHRHGRHDASERRLLEAVAVNDRIGDRYQKSMNLGNLGLLLISTGSYPAALSSCQESLLLSWRIGSQVMSAWLIDEIAHLLLLLGEHPTAARLLGTTEAVLASLGTHHGPTALQSMHEDTVAGLRSELGAERFEELLADGRRTTLESAVELALSVGP